MSNGQHIWFDEPTSKRDDYLHKQKMDLKRVSWSEAKHNDIENYEWAICPFCRCSLCCHTNCLVGKDMAVVCGHAGRTFHFFQPK
ncbi:hypothetical protein ACFX1Q_030363 [Malus domestica]